MYSAMINECMPAIVCIVQVRAVSAGNKHAKHSRCSLQSTGSILDFVLSLTPPPPTLLPSITTPLLAYSTVGVSLRLRPRQRASTSAFACWMNREATAEMTSAAGARFSESSLIAAARPQHQGCLWPWRYFRWGGFSCKRRNRIEWSTVSNAADRSRRTKAARLPLSTSWRMNLISLQFWRLPHY